MDREILFRGKRLDNGEWVEGGYWLNNTVTRQTAHIIDYDGVPHAVDPSTVGQYTGLNDENGKKIFEGDYLGDWGENENGEECICIMGVVTYRASEGRYVLADENGLYNDWTLEDESQPENWNHLIHCGNIHDNPELIGGEGDG